MANSIYKINRGINQSIEFKGLKSQYIWYLGAAFVTLLVLFSVMYIIGIPTLACLALVVIGGSVSVTVIYRLSRKYGEHGLMKSFARRKVPKAIKWRNRQVFLHLKRD